MGRSRFHADADHGGETELTSLISTYLDALIFNL